MMNKSLLFYKNNKDVLFTTFAQLWKLVSGPLNLMLIPIYLTSLDQGFWYTFISLSALSIFADLGFTTIILQFSAHEYAFLKFENNQLVGDPQSLDRITSLFRFVVKWTVVLMIFVFPIITGIGFYMFQRKSDDFFWVIPWLVYLLASSGVFFVSVINSFVQGFKQVAKVQRIIFYSAVSSTIVLVTLLILGHGLYALAFSLLANALVSFALLFRNYHTLFVQLWQHKGEEVNWRREIIPLLSKYAISWSSAYFVYNIYTPLMFQFHGSEEAGKVGLTMSVLSSIFALAYVWINAKTPLINIIVAERNWTELDRLIKKLFIYSSLTYLFGVLAFMLVYLGFLGTNSFLEKVLDRFLTLVPVAMLALALYVHMLLGLMAVYLRAHKQEPYMYISLLNGIYILVVTYLATKYLSADYLFIGFLSGHLLIIYPAYFVFKKKRLAWH